MRALVGSKSDRDGGRSELLLLGLMMLRLLRVLTGPGVTSGKAGGRRKCQLPERLSGCGVML